MYELTLIFNGKEFSKKVEADSVRDAILSFKPAVLHTDIFVKLKKGKDLRERHLLLLQGKKLFNNDIFLQVFVMNLLLK